MSQASTIAKWALVVLLFSPKTTAFRIAGTENETKPFVPYEKGFVGYSGYPIIRTRTNPGYETYSTNVGHNRLQSCPGMVGPLDDNKFYCLGKEYGYCDRRSGTCYCNDGYKGLSCDDCAPSHFLVGSLCYPRKPCPNDCSSAGTCDYLTGICECHEHRQGMDCSEFSCVRYHEYCRSCDANGCIECIEGWGVMKNLEIGRQCESCSRFDPRCKDCNETACLSCMDLLLTSIRRSGKRNSDPELPDDERMRELSITVPFGSLQSNAFDEAEPYFLADPELDLKNSAIACDQGTTFDSSFDCYKKNISNIVCGHHGFFSFLSPEYEILEGENYIRLGVMRDGGGVGSVNVSYAIQHITTNDSDLTSTAFYATEQVLHFSPHEVQKTFLISIHDDQEKEGNETFAVTLFDPTTPSQLGNQYKTVVTIIDNDFKSCSEPFIIPARNTFIVGQVASLQISTKKCAHSISSVRMDIEVFMIATVRTDKVYFSSNTIDFFIIENIGNHSYQFNNIGDAGLYDIHVFHLLEGGLRGSYYSDEMYSPDHHIKSRVDAVVNFTWSEATVSSVRWEGVIKPLMAGPCMFYISGDNVRLWIDGFLLIDEWSQNLDGRLASARFDFQSADKYHRIVLEVRELITRDPVKLMWAFRDVPMQVIPQSSLFYKVDIRGSPYRLTMEQLFRQ